jgi:hypothetical protein
MNRIRVLQEIRPMRFGEACTIWQEQAADAGRSGAKGGRLWPSAVGIDRSPDLAGYQPPTAHSRAPAATTSTTK